ncbi:MAG: class I SAM-dependent methyltransferase [Balneolales bacterium]
MFTKTAKYYDALYHFKNYKDASEKIHELVNVHNPNAATLLDVACGTGKHLEYLVKYYDVEGLDLNPELLNVAQRRSPDIKFHEADMTDFNLNTTYDVVTCLFSSIGYVQSLDKMNRAIKCMAKHINPGGVILVEPWVGPDQYWEGKFIANYVDQPDLKIAWMYKNEREKLTSVFDIQYMVGSSEGIIKFSEKHVMGLWTVTEYKQAFQDAGININFDPKGPFGRGLYYGIKQ